MSAADPIVVALLERLLEGQAAILAEMRAGREARSADSRTLANADLLRAIYETCGLMPFMAADLIESAALPERADLGAAILGCIGAASVKKLGKRLKKIEGAELGGLVVHQVSQEREGAMWKIRDFAGFKPA